MADAFTPAERAAIMARREPYGVECPACGAGPGLACVAGHGDRARVVPAHASRRAASARAVGEASRG